MTQTSYTVLARRYRPTRLCDLIGQDILQETLTEAILQNHLPHAILLHGIRGVGKTTTARIIARALNCQGADGKGGVTPNPCGVCSSCLDIQNDRHLDVIEMDAASRTGVDDIRDLIESARYKAVKGRFKIFIIDEVHMLSKSAFNALLKTLEEPPAHVKFIFATTELRKIPDTILSRCMRFDLKRIEPAVILGHLKDLCGLEKIEASVDALGMIARAGDGSMRDALSLLDQAIALSLSHTQEGVTVELVQRMLGTTNREHIFTLIHALFKGDADGLLTLTDSLFLQGADPLLLMQEILECVYWLTCLKTQPTLQKDPTWPADERKKGADILEGLGIASLARAWQLLSKGYEEIQKNPLPKRACQMVFIRFCHLSTLPPIEKIIDTFTQNGNNAPSSTRGSTQTGHTPSTQMRDARNTDTDTARADAHSRTAPRAAQMKDDHSAAANAQSLNKTTTTEALPPQQIPQTFSELINLLHMNKEILLASLLEQEARVIDYKPFHITMNLDTKRLSQLPAQLRKTLQHLTAADWVLNISNGTLGKTMLEEHNEALASALLRAQETPIIKELLTAFPKATLTMEKYNASN